MKVIKVKYTEIGDEPLYDWIKVREVYVLKNSFLVVSEAEVRDAKGENPSYVTLRLEYPKSLLRKFKKKHALT